MERSQRTDEDEFYRRTTFRSAAELAAKLRRWEHEYSHRRPHLALAGKTPAERLCELRRHTVSSSLRITLAVGIEGRICPRTETSPPGYISISPPPQQGIDVVATAPARSRGAAFSVFKNPHDQHNCNQLPLVARHARAMYGCETPGV